MATNELKVKDCKVCFIYIYSVAMQLNQSVCLQGHCFADELLLPVDNIRARLQWLGLFVSVRLRLY